MVREGRPPTERKAAFDAERRAHFEQVMANPNSGDTWWYALRLAERHGKRLLDPYLDRVAYEYFSQFDHERLSPLRKPLVRQALAGHLERLPRGSIAVGVQMQTGGGVDSLFAMLLKDDRINRFDKKYTTVSALCQRWGSEVRRDPEPFRTELRALPPRAAAAKYLCKPGRYEPYTTADVHRAAAQRKFTAVSMFAGGGGSCVGIALAGGHVVLANEFVAEAARTYRANFPNTQVDERDIREIAASPETIAAFLAQADLRSGEVDVIAAYPPCCEYSTGRRARSDHGKLRPYSDTRQRNMQTLVFDLFELTRLALPKVVIVENIPALESRFPALFEVALDALRYSSGPRVRLYYASAMVLSAADFGVAQDRRRLFFIGVRRDVAEAVGITSDGDVSAVFPDPTHAPVSIRSALANLPQTGADLEPWRWAMMTSALGRIVHHLPRDPRTLIRPRHVGLPKDSRFTLSRCARDYPAPTLTVTGQGPGGLSGALHPLEDRKFSLPELKRLTALPDDFQLTGTLAQASERVGRMVPPPLMRAIAEAIYERVLGPDARRSK